MREHSGFLRHWLGPSLTATLVASVRAYYAELPQPYGVGADRASKELVPALFSLPARVAGHADKTAAAAMHVGLGAAFLGLPYHLALRTHAIDHALREAIMRGGAEQVVLLGAGLDNRALRIDELANVPVFEVDHQATQQYKARRLAHAGFTRPPNVTLVSVDFERDRLKDRLQDCGFSPHKTTFWIWEGVVVYLSSEAMRGTLAAIARCGATGSRLALTYTQPGVVGGRLLWNATTWAARVIGEPVLGSIRREDLHRELGEMGFAVLSDQSPLDLAKEVWPGVPPGIREWERVLVAQRI